jgi:hypothetical protein
VGAASARQATRLAARAVALGARNLAPITPFHLPGGPPRVALDEPSPAQLDTLRTAIEELT